ncbi:hypothetical protein GW17_00019701 [Ensete ventricosum]|nr:hypothetical protein GW17_00019701 [Ensete ventricosum]
MQWELVESSLEVTQGLDDVVGSSPRAHQRFAGKFLGSSPTSGREFVGSSLRMLRVRREFAEGNQELIEGSSKGCREFVE